MLLQNLQELQQYMSSGGRMPSSPSYSSPVQNLGSYLASCRGPNALEAAARIHRSSAGWLRTPFSGGHGRSLHAGQPWVSGNGVGDFVKLFRSWEVLQYVVSMLLKLVLVAFQMKLPNFC